MSVFEFEAMLEERKTTMLCVLLELSGDKNELKTIIREAYEECTNDFEEQCVTEGLNEVFSDWMKGLKGAA